MDVFPNWRRWRVKPSATIDECVLLSMGLNPESKEFYIAPFNDSIGHWSKPVRSSGSGANWRVAEVSGKVSIEEFIKKGLGKCAWARAFPNMTYEEKCALHKELRERSLIASDHRTRIVQTIKDCRRLSVVGLGVTFAYFEASLSFDLCEQAQQLADQSVERVRHFSSPKHRDGDQNEGRGNKINLSDNSYSVVIVGLLRELNQINQKKYPIPWGDKDERLSLKEIKHMLSHWGFSPDDKTLRAIFKACREISSK